MNNPPLPYTASDIKRYLEGAMSNAEMYRLELAALDDPFLQDAIDGYSQAAAGEQPEKINEIVAELEQFKAGKNIHKYRNIVIPIWQNRILKYTAAAIIAGSAGWFLINHSQPYDRDLMAEQKIHNKATDTASLATTNEIKIPDTNFTLTQANQASDPSHEVVVNTKQKSKQPALSITEKNTSVVSDLATERPEALNNDRAKTIAGPPVSYASETDVSKKPVSAPSVISGKVLDVDNYPLDNISINVKGTQKRTVTDELGRFNLAIADSQAVVVASGRGFKTREIPGYMLKDKLVMKLERDDDASDKVIAAVDGYRELEYAMDTVEAVPVGGWDAFEKYLESIKTKRKAAKKSQNVVLTFEVDKNGVPTEFEIIESAGDYYDFEAIKAIKDGPKWKNKTRNPYPIVKLTLSFKSGKLTRLQK